ncbi:MAG: histidine phosphatase family protein [Clostridia bacterium]|nr:histidine phosphatase family protein [Clostridia bacterium]
MLLYIIRHGDPDYPTDTLTLRGMFQAEAVGRRIAASKIDRIFSSPMGRARLTASPACRMLGLPCEIEEWAHEIGDEKQTTFPDGKRKKTIAAVQNTYFRADGAQDLAFADSLLCPGFSTTNLRPALDYIAAGGRDFLARLGYREEDGIYRILRPNEERVALFCHAAFTRAWLSHLLHIPPHLFWSGFNTTHTGVTVVEFHNHPNGITAPRVLCLSDMSHLYAEGLDMRYDNYAVL